METGKLPFKEFWAMFTRVRPLMVIKEKPGRAGRPKWRHRYRGMPRFGGIR